MKVERISQRNYKSIRNRHIHTPCILKRKMFTSSCTPLNIHIVVRLLEYEILSLISIPVTSTQLFTGNFSNSFIYYCFWRLFPGIPKYLLRWLIYIYRAWIHYSSAAGYNTSLLVYLLRKFNCSNVSQMMKRKTISNFILKSQSYSSTRSF